MSIVYVTQIPHKKDAATGAFVPTININTAAEHGQIVTMFPPRAAYVDTAILLDQAAQKLENYDFERGDSLLLMGDSAIMAVCIAVLAKRVREIAVLRFDKVLHRYVRVKFNLGDIV